MRKCLIIISFGFLSLALTAQETDAIVDSIDNKIIEAVEEIRKSDSLAKALEIQKARTDSLEKAVAKEDESAPPANVEEAVEDVQENIEETADNIREAISPSKIISILLVLLITWLMVKAMNWLFDKTIQRFPNRRLQILKVKPVLGVLIWFLSIFGLIKAVFDPDPDTVWALVGSSALALGFALQDVLKNIFGGLMIIIDRPFQVGDRIQVKETYGEVKNIGLRTTQINTLDDNLVTVPNSVIINDNVSNANSGAYDCMVVVDLYLPIDVDVEKARTLAREAAITSSYLNIDKPVSVLFLDHFDNQAVCHIKVKAYVLDALYEKPFASDVTEAAKKAFADAGLYKRAVG